MTIGSLSWRTGVPVKTLRAYQDMGLIYTVGRSPGNYRLFGEEAVADRNLAADPGGDTDDRGNNRTVWIRGLAGSGQHPGGGQLSYQGGHGVRARLARGPGRRRVPNGALGVVAPGPAC